MRRFPVSRLAFPKLAVGALGLVALGWSDEIATERPTPSRDAQVFYPEERGPARPPVLGDGFPDGVLALTWDDGPDVGTTELARDLADAKVAATFFVVGEWLPGVSEEPGFGERVYTTGFEHLPVLPELLALGHRIGSHTQNHVLLGSASAVTIAEQLGQAQHEIDPLLTNELRLFRAPGGAWTRSSAAALTDPFLAGVVGPIHWDIDAKDWESSVYCRSERPSEECEPGPLGWPRVKAAVVAARYVALAERRRRGIVLFHDRVGDVGSRYAREIARHVVPELARRGFVFAAPVLAFSEVAPRLLCIVGRDRADCGLAP